MWTVVYIAVSREAAEQVRLALLDEGILATLRPVGLQAMGEAVNFEVMVSEVEAEEANELLNNTTLGRGPG